MADVAHAFIAQSRRFLSDDYLPKIERCLDALSEEDVWWRANASDGRCCRRGLWAARELGRSGSLATVSR